jgi:hypothetical protein
MVRVGGRYRAALNAAQQQYRGMRSWSHAGKRNASSPLRRCPPASSRCLAAQSVRMSQRDSAMSALRQRAEVAITSLAVRVWHEPAVGGRAKPVRSAPLFQTSTCSVRASSTSMQRYRTVLSVLVCPVLLSNAVLFPWTSAGELGAPVVAKAHNPITHEVRDGRMISYPAK